MESEKIYFKKSGHFKTEGLIRRYDKGDFLSKTEDGMIWLNYIDTLGNCMSIPLWSRDDNGNESTDACYTRWSSKKSSNEFWEYAKNK